MENVISILTLQPEEMPKWLMDYKPGDKVSFNDFMASAAIMLVSVTEH